ncbi:MAG: hypothetical protein BGO25_19515 [Acidobacteriales bacterium 59-55]|nr:MAG: hypothetical protein BGO25_19515 [Acidobacteriales bacterium 59-55]
MMAQTPLKPLPFPVFRALDQSGKPLAGGLLYSYTAGTSTPQATYTDASGVTPNTNPVVLDSTGSAKVFLSNSAYKFILEDQFGVIQWTVDDIVGGPAASISPTPTSSQTITQPAGTSLNVNILNNVYNAAMFSGSDIGAKINAAIAAVGCGTVIVPAGTYPYTTTIIKPRCILLKGQGLIATKLNYSSNSGVAIVVGDSASGTQYGVGGIEGLAFVGTSTGLGTTNTSVGLWIGGDPAWGVPCGGSGTSGVIPCNYNGDNQAFTGVGVSGFEIGMKTANNAYVDTFTSSNIFANWFGVSQAANSFNAGENNRFVASDVFNNTGGGFFSANSWKLFGTSIDFNNDGTSTTLATHAQIIDTGYECYGCHAEGWSGAISTGNQPFSWFGGTILLDSTASIIDPVIVSSSAASISSMMTGASIFSGHAVTALAGMTGGGQSSVYISGLSGNGNGTIAATLSPGSNPGFKYLNPNFQFIDGGGQTVNGGLTLVQNSSGWQEWRNTNTSVGGVKITPLNNHSIFINDTTINANSFDLTVHKIIPANGYSGTCASGTTITVVSGIITGCV